MTRQYRYFVAINYGIKHNQYWVNMVSVIDSKLCFRIKFDDLNNTSVWRPGWQDIKEGGPDFTPIANPLIDNYHSNQDCCLHASCDSGLNCSPEITNIRPWLQD